MKNSSRNIVFILLVLLASCREGQKNSEINSLDTLERPVVHDPAISSSSYPGENDLGMQVLLVGNFHHSEVDPAVAGKNWMGLFQNQDSFYLRSVSIQVSRIHDPVLDGVGEKTGWLVRVPGQDRCLLLMEQRDFFKEGPVTAVDIPSAQVLPGDTMSIVQNEQRYQLLATGSKTVTSPGASQYRVTNYRLYLEGKRGAFRYRTLLVAHPDFDDQMVSLLFAGDLDTDGYPDFIINTSRHYNMNSPTLYLSGIAGDSALVKPAGRMVITGG